MSDPLEVHEVYALRDAAMVVDGCTCDDPPFLVVDIDESAGTMELEISHNAGCPAN